jgi:hypothetical protein
MEQELAKVPIMSWTWSVGTEAAHYANRKLHAMAQKHIFVIWAEWKTYQKAQEEAREEARAEAEENDWPEPTQGIPSQDFDQEYYKEQLKEAKAIKGRVGKEALADDIWKWASEQRTCDNGGWNAWMCPYGCSPHCVPFSNEKRN